MKEKNVIIQVLRIIACIGVFNGHFLGLTLNSNLTTSFLSFLRNGWISRTVLCLLFQGDTNVRLFFVISGYLSMVSLTRAEKNIVKKVVNRYIFLVVPAIMVTLMCGICWKIQEMLGSTNVNFKIDELFYDIIKIIVTGGIPYYSYQLWFINDMCNCMFLLAAMYLLWQENETKLIKILYLIIWGILSLKSVSYFSFFCGMMAAVLAKEERIVLIGKKYRNVISVLCVLLFPFLFNEQHLSAYNIMTLSICFAILLLTISVKNGNGLKPFCKKGIDFLDNNSYSFYLVHVFVQKTVTANVYYVCPKYIQNEIWLIVMLYVFTFGITWILAHVFTKTVIIRVRKVF